MFLGLALFVILGIALSIIVIKALKALFRLLTGNGKQPDEGNTKAVAADKVVQTGKKKEQKEAESESETAEKSEGAEMEPVSEELKSRYAFSQLDGITESEWTGEAKVDLDPAAVESRCVQQSSITHLEFANRDLAGDDFYGFNILVEVDKKMTLTYNGQAVASITKIDVSATAVINGEEVKGTVPGYRVNTFPPVLKPGMVPSDLEKMIGAAERVRACGGNPEWVAEAMMGEFCLPENISRLKSSVDGKIQQKESSPRKQEVQKKESGHKRILAKG